MHCKSRGLQLGQEWVLGGSRTTLPNYSAPARRKMLCMTWLQSPSAHRLQDQQMVGAICGLEDFPSNSNTFCLRTALPWHCPVNVPQLTSKPDSNPSRSWRMHLRKCCTLLPPVKGRRVYQLPSPFNERSLILSALLRYMTRCLA